MTTGIIYHARQRRTSGSVWLNLPQPAGRFVARYYLRQYRKPIASPLRIISSIAFLIAGTAFLLTMLPVAAVELQYQLNQRLVISRGTERLEVRQLPIQSGFNFDPIPTVQPAPTNAWEAFSIRIPKINAESIVLPNIDAGNPKVYLPALQKGIAHALGTGLPGVTSDINRTIYLFAHSTSAPQFIKQYNAQFYLLHDLEAGDEIEITFWTTLFRYRVVETRVVDPTDTSFLEPQTEQELLVLATCWPPGTTSKRFLVLAERI